MKNFYLHLFYFTASILFLNGCVNNSKYNAETSDPFESTNRKIFAFNTYVDENVIEPVSKQYVQKVPLIARDGLSKHLYWMSLPSTIFNSTIQLDLENTVLASAKFMLNGLSLGFYDLDNNQTNVDKKDFGSTLASFNVPEGPYLMLPFLGPKNTRDFSGSLFDRYSLSKINSSDLDTVSQTEIPINIVVKREKLSPTLSSIYSSSDPYIKMRSFYIQNRRGTVNNNQYNEVKNQEKDQEFEKFLQ